MQASSPIITRAPHSPVDRDGRPALGAYRGYAERVSWHALARDLRRGGLWRKLHTKTWHYASIVNDACVLALAIIDVGIAASAFAYVFDRRAGRLLTNVSFTGLPGTARFTERAGPGAASRFKGRGARFAIEHRAGNWHIEGQTRGGFELVARLDPATAPAPLCAIASIAGGVANCTHKTVGLAASGSVAVGGVRFDLAGGTGALDHTHGLLARDTRWRWASATRPGLSLNLVEDFNGPVENVVWIGDELLPVGPVSFAYDPSATSRPWGIRSSNGVLDLEFTPIGERREDKNLLVAKSWYVQPIGTFRGVIRIPERPPLDVNDLVGVTEDHVARW